ncbi:hypothetical protein EYC80_005714 [Monilinia laxa]|uniref:Uncharacterized protein n=1 Tax=Monilinia laxa TaxID=61186 RepID=A0A5N6KEU5_MONLA|nr:hypothetical protein EYC80_005714 [Monilinia laxa]
MADEASTRDEVVPPQTTDSSAPDAVVEPQVEVSEGANSSNGVQDGAASEDPVATSGTSATEESMIAFPSYQFPMLCFY